MIKLLFGGDFCPNNKIEKLVLDGDTNKIDRVFETIVPFAKQNDYIVVNLECPLTHSQDAIEKTGPILKADPKTIVLMQNLGVNMVALANNHIYDYGNDGLLDTMTLCHKHGISTVGAGETLTDAQKYYIADIKGKRIAFVNIAENEFCNAGEIHGGANPLDIIENIRQIHDARKVADAVIVIIHGGHEHFAYPSPRMVKTYRFFAEQGAAAIIAHHPHCACGYEVHNGTPIFYSLGNLLFSNASKMDGWYLGYLVELSLGFPGGCEFSIIPYSQCRGELAVNPLDEVERRQFDERLKELSIPLTDLHDLHTIWDNFAKKKDHTYIYSLSPLTKYTKRVLAKLGLFTFFIPRNFLLGLLNRLRCESHRDLMLHAIQDSLIRKKS
jgi:hypothetical protein